MMAVASAISAIKRPLDAYLVSPTQALGKRPSIGHGTQHPNILIGMQRPYSSVHQLSYLIQDHVRLSSKSRNTHHCRGLNQRGVGLFDSATDGCIHVAGGLQYTDNEKRISKTHQSIAQSCAIAFSGPVAPRSFQCRQSDNAVGLTTLFLGHASPRRRCTTPCRPESWNDRRSSCSCAHTFTDSTTPNVSPFVTAVPTSGSST